MVNLKAKSVIYIYIAKSWRKSDCPSSSSPQWLVATFRLLTVFIIVIIIICLFSQYLLVFYKLIV